MYTYSVYKQKKEIGDKTDKFVKDFSLNVWNGIFDKKLWKRSSNKLNNSLISVYK